MVNLKSEKAYHFGVVDKLLQYKACKFYLIPVCSRRIS